MIMDKKQLINQYCHQFKMSGIPEGIDQLVQQAESSAIGYLDYTVSLFGAEARHREQKDIKKRIRAAQLPRSSDLDTYDHSLDNGLKTVRLNQLRELNWLDQIFNIILLGPSGTGKTFPVSYTHLTLPTKRIV